MSPPPPVMTEFGPLLKPSAAIWILGIAIAGKSYPKYEPAWDGWQKRKCVIIEYICKIDHVYVAVAFLRSTVGAWFGRGAKEAYESRTQQRPDNAWVERRCQCVQLWQHSLAYHVHVFRRYVSIGLRYFGFPPNHQPFGSRTPPGDVVSGDAYCENCGN